MKTLKMIGLCSLATIIWVPGLRAQVPAPPVAAVAVPAPAAKNIFTMLLPSHDQIDACKDRICNGPLGPMLRSAAKPLAGMTGGIIGGQCAIPTDKEIAKMLDKDGKVDSAAGAAAEIKKSEAEAKARREAIRYLGTVDCNYWPDAKAQLIAGLRLDPNECVRFEAALALNRGCCCNKDIIKALKSSAAGDDKDGAPHESSERVRAAAYEAYLNCVMNHPEPVEPKERQKEAPPREVPVPAEAKAKTDALLAQEKERLAQMKNASPSRQQGLLGVFAAASGMNGSTNEPPMPNLPSIEIPVHRVTYSYSNTPTTTKARTYTAAPVTFGDLVQVEFEEPSHADAQSSPYGVLNGGTQHVLLPASTTPPTTAFPSR